MVQIIGSCIPRTMHSGSVSQSLWSSTDDTNYECLGHRLGGLSGGASTTPTDRRG